MELAEKDLSGNVLTGIGTTLVSVEKQVANDFQVLCFQQGAVDRQVGNTVCLHTAFLEDNFKRITITPTLSIDLLFHDSNYARSLGRKSKQPDIGPEKCPRDCEPEVEESKDKFWLTLSEQVLHCA